MKRIFLCLLALALLLEGAALAAGYNSFMDDGRNAGIFDNFAWDGEYVYWLHTPESDNWADVPANLYRMRPGASEPELLLGGSDQLWLHRLMNLGGRLFLCVSETMDGPLSPALMNFDGSGFEVLSGTVGSCVLSQSAIYNSVDGQIFRIPLDSMKPKSIFKYPEELLQHNPVLRQCADGKLYFSTEEHAWYEMNLNDGKLRKIAGIRGDGFVLDGMLYIADYDALDGTWRYDVDTGNRVKVSERTYNFKQGSGKYVRATGDDANSWFQGVIFDFSSSAADLEVIRLADCDENYDILLDGRLLRYDWQNNRVAWSDEIVLG